MTNTVGAGFSPRLSQTQITILRRLRPGAPLPLGELGALASSACNSLRALLAAGLVERLGAGSDVRYRITDAGLAACPRRNPVSAKCRPAPRQGEHVHGPTPRVSMDLRDFGGPWS